MNVLQGTLDILILTALQAESRHGYGVAEEIAARTAGEITVEDAALYKALHRLEARGLVDSEWGLSESRRRAKFYRITARGRRALESETDQWRRYVELMGRAISPRG